MSCDPFRELVSRHLDGDLDPTEVDALGKHLADCPSCRAFDSEAMALRSTMDLRATPTPASLHRTLGTVHAARDRWRLSWRERVRYLLAVVSGTLVVLNIPTLFDTSVTGAEAHASRHLGAFGLAFGCGLLVAAVRPSHIPGIMPFALALGATMLGGAIVDLASGASTMLGEAIHALEFTALVLLCVLALGRRREHSPATA